MELNIFKLILLSLSLILLVHYIFNYLQASFTVPKVKDMINRPNEKYESIMKVVNSYQSGNINSNANPHANPDTIPDMKNELDSYINEINSNKNENINSINSETNQFNSSHIPQVPGHIPESDNTNDTTPISQLNTYSENILNT